MFSQNQVQHLLIGKSSTSLTASAVKPAGMNTGEIGAFTKGGTKLLGAGAVAGTPFVLYKEMADGSLLKSDVLSTANVEKIIRKAAVAATEKLEYYGYNGVSGSFEALDETFYRIKIEMKEGYTANDHGTTYVKHAIYESDASAVQSEIALGLAKNGNANFSREVKNSSSNPPIMFKAICNTALDTANCMDETITVTKGSKFVSVANDYDYNTGTDLVVGDFIRIADTDTTAALTDAVYKIIAISANVVSTTDMLELDRPYTGTSGTRTHANDSTQAITIAQGAAADWGIALAGQAQDFTVGKIGYKKIDWVSGIEGTTSTTYTSSTSATPGINVYEQIAELEWFCQGNEGNFTRKGYPFIDNPRAEVENTTYETIDIIYNDENSNLVGANKNRKVLTLAITTSNPAFFTDNTNGLAVMLEGLLAGTPVYGGLITASGGALAAGDLD